MSIRRPLTYLVIFAVITGFLTLVLVVSIQGYSGKATTSYRAEFTDATKLKSGDDVRIAGVSVGKVTGVRLDPAAHALVTFTVDSSVPLTSTTTATIRFRNLIGERYVAVDAPATGTPLARGGLIPLARTAPALNLTAVFDGFRPLLQGLDASSINAVSYSLVQALQGEGGTLASLLGNTGVLGSTVAAHDAQIGALVTQLNAVLATVNDRTTDVDGLIGNLDALTGQLAATRTQDLDALAGVDQLASATDALLSQARPGLAGSVAGVQQIAQQLAENKTVLDEKLKLLPVKLNAVARAAQYGSWFQFFNCGIGVQVTLPNLPAVGVPPSGPGSGICGG